MYEYTDKLAQRLEWQHESSAPKGNFLASVLIKFLPMPNALPRRWLLGRYDKFYDSVKHRAVNYHYTQVHALDPVGHLKLVRKYQGMLRTAAPAREPPN